MYHLEIRDGLYRGREDFVYRIHVGEFPFVTDYFPLGGMAGAPVKIECRGWNLPTTRFVWAGQPFAGLISPPMTRLGLRVHPLLRFAVDTLPEAREPTQGARGAPTRITPPVVLNGVIERPGEQATYGFDGKKGQTMWRKSRRDAWAARWMPG